MATSTLLGELRRIVGDSHLLADPDVTLGYRTAWTGEQVGSPLAVARPADLLEVQALVRTAAGAGVPVIPQGGNTGLAMGAIPTGGELIVSLRRLGHVAVDPEGSPTLVAGGGATLQAVRDGAATAGFEFPLDINARADATVGGMIATDAAGRHAWRHGSMRVLTDRVQAVLADGSAVGGTGHGPGTGIEHLLSGSEGALALITAARVRLGPARPRRGLAVIPVPSAEAAVEATSAAVRVTEVESVEVVFHCDAVDLLRDTMGIAPLFDPPSHAYLYVETATTGDPVAALAGLIPAGAERTLIGEDRDTRERLWRPREALSEVRVGTGPVFKAAVGIPRSAVPRFEAAVRLLFAPHPTTLFGHLAGQAMHVNVHGLAQPDHAAARADLIDLTRDHGGWIAAEHGFGRTYAPWIARVVPAADRAAVAAVKRALDPLNTLNPGVGPFSADR